MALVFREGEPLDLSFSGPNGKFHVYIYIYKMRFVPLEVDDGITLLPFPAAMPDRGGKILYKFIVDLLGNSELQVVWISSSERIFQITNKAALAEAWGNLKKIPNYSVPSLRKAIE